MVMDLVADGNRVRERVRGRARGREGSEEEEVSSQDKRYPNKDGVRTGEPGDPRIGVIQVTPAEVSV
jgi:hypothetical protein